RERQLVCRRREVLEVDLLRLVVEDRALHGAVEELVGVAAEELVERVVARDVHGEAGLAAPGPAPHLPKRSDRARERDAERGVAPSRSTSRNSTPASSSASSSGFAIVALARMKRGSVPYARARRRSRRRTFATCEPNTPRYTCASSTTIQARFASTSPHWRWC